MAQRVKTDPILFWTILVLVSFGLVMVYSSSSVMAELKYRNSTYFIVRQAIWAVIAFVALMYAKHHDYRKLRDPRWAFGALSLVLIMLVAVYVADGRQHRWFRTPIGSLQPSEFAKPALILFLAYFMSRRGDSVNARHSLAQGTLVMAVLAIVVAIPDLGTAVVLVATAGVAYFVAGLHWRYCIVGVAVVGILAGIAIVSKPYRLARVVDKFDSSHDLRDVLDSANRIDHYIAKSETTRDASYQPRQARIAVGSGGWLGLGLMQSRQKWLFLPESHTDYIYAVVGEELGLFGTIGILIGFVIILWRGLRLYFVAPDEFGRYIALGVTTSIVVQAMINMSVVLGMGPTKGIPLPMISNGGSSLLSTLLCLGLMLSVSERSSA